MFITLEGIEGSGKTTQIGHIVEFLEGKGRRCVATREPGGTSIGARIRSILLDPECKDLHPKAELLLYMADRAQHIHTVILPGLAEGRTVVCDRYLDATLVYQGAARGLGPEFAGRLHQLVFDDLQPDLTLLLDLPARTGLNRAIGQIANGSRNQAESRFEEEALSFHEKVRTGYLELARLNARRFRIIDATRTPDQVREQILKVLSVFIQSPIQTKKQAE